VDIRNTWLILLVRTKHYIDALGDIVGIIGIPGRHINGMHVFGRYIISQRGTHTFMGLGVAIQMGGVIGG
jgi:hypothetical protein